MGNFLEKKKKNKAQEFGIDVEEVSEAAAELSSVNPLKAYHSIPRGTTCNGKTVSIYCHHFV